MLFDIIIKDNTIFDENFMPETEEGFNITFETTNEGKTLEALDNIFKKEVEFLEKNSSKPVNTYIKNLPFELRVACFKHALENENLLDSNFILNIFNFIKGFNTFEDDFFECKEIFVNNLVEFLDLKIEIQDLLIHLQNEIIRYYVSIVRSCGIIEVPDIEQFVSLPYLYQRIFYISDFVSLSNMMKDKTEVTDLVKVDNAVSYITALSQKMIYSDFLMNSFTGATNDNSNE